MQKKKLKKPSCLYTIIALFVSESFHVGKRDIKKELEENEDRNLFSKKGVEIEHEDKTISFLQRAILSAYERRYYRTEERRKERIIMVTNILLVEF